MNKEFNKQITLYGSRKEIEEAENILKTVEIPSEEPKARIVIQDLIDKHKIKAHILFDGNSIWSFDKVIRDFKRLLNTNNLTDNMYNFFHLCCGTIAHYNKYGWQDIYKNKTEILKLMYRNEFGGNILDHQPSWATDRQRIIEEMFDIVR